MVVSLSTMKLLCHGVSQKFSTSSLIDNHLDDNGATHAFFRWAENGEIEIEGAHSALTFPTVTRFYT